jgi:hypothetical protein
MAMTELTVGRSTIQIVELVQPLCANNFGFSPCTATGSNATKCFNTRATCQDPANYDGSSSLSLFFSSGTVAEQKVSGAPYIIPSLVSVSTSPTRVNLSGVNTDASGLGNRALVSISFKDHPHTDRRVDPYVDGRGGDPFTKGSFWSKWIVRNKFWNLIRINVYEGYEGQALGSMLVRTYFMNNISGPDDRGNVTIQGKDVLARIEERKAQAPSVSSGELYTNIDALATSFEVSNAVEAEYDASGVVRIGDELIVYSSRATSTNGVTFTVSSRGYKRTVAAEHSFESEVQQCVEYNRARVDTVLEDLLTTYGGVPSSFLDTVNWADEVDGYNGATQLTTVISEPTAVSELISEILQQVGAYLWWDERDQLVKYKVVRGVTEEAPLLTAENNIMPNFRVVRLPRQRVSQVWFYYTIRSYISDLEKPSNFESATIVVAPESETEEQYGEPSIKKIFSRWFLTAAGANTTASRLATRYVDVPRQATFEVDAKDREYWTGDVIRISHPLLVDQYGERDIGRWTIISAEEVLSGEVIRYTCDDTTLYGKSFFIQATGSPDYVNPASIGFNKGFIGNASGLLSDGTEAAKIG